MVKEKIVVPSWIQKVKTQEFSEVRESEDSLRERLLQAPLGPTLNCPSNSPGK